MNGLRVDVRAVLRRVKHARVEEERIASEFARSGSCITSASEKMADGAPVHAAGVFDRCSSGQQLLKVFAEVLRVAWPLEKR
jgi:hypothetical protein